MRHIEKIIQVLLFVYILIVVGLTVLQVIFRNMGVSISGYDEIIGIAAIWSYFLGMAHTTLTDSHIKGGLDELITNPTAKYLLGMLSNVGLLLFSVIALVASIGICMTALSLDYRTLYFDIPVALSLFALVVGFGLNILFIVMRGIHRNSQPR
ncbi:TRAP transporter small permease [Castellaniella sp.]|uniref:TRAP transporter small permease n=1 Tax=Castellaniella sp. TaxID=1955812 RepID=UPI0035697FB9